MRLTRRQNPVIMDVPDGNISHLLPEPLRDNTAEYVALFQLRAFRTGSVTALTETKARMARLLRWLGDTGNLPADAAASKCTSRAVG